MLLGIGIGDSNLDVAMHVDDSLLGRITAQFSTVNYITFESLLGSIEIHSVLQSTHMDLAKTAQIKLITSADVQFTSGDSDFHTLEVQSNICFGFQNKMVRKTSTLGDMWTFLRKIL